MNNKFNQKRFWAISVVITALTAFIIGYSPINANNQTLPPKPANVAAVQQNCEVTAANPLEIVGNPNSYINKTVKFKATFDKFSALGLDYKPAMKSSQQYIGILIKRDDIKDHTIPLSEMKLFLARPEAEKYIDLNSGDSVEIVGKVFSTALGDPWIDISKFTVLTPPAKKLSTK